MELKDLPEEMETKAANLLTFAPHSISSVIACELEAAKDLDQYRETLDHALNEIANEATGAFRELFPDAKSVYDEQPEPKKEGKGKDLESIIDTMVVVREEEIGDREEGDCLFHFCRGGIQALRDLKKHLQDFWEQPEEPQGKGTICDICKSEKEVYQTPICCVCYERAGTSLEELRFDEQPQGKGEQL